MTYFFLCSLLAVWLNRRRCKLLRLPRQIYSVIISSTLHSKASATHIKAPAVSHPKQGTPSLLASTIDLSSISVSVSLVLSLTLCPFSFSVTPPSPTLPPPTLSLPFPLFLLSSSPFCSAVKYVDQWKWPINRNANALFPFSGHIFQASKMHHRWIIQSILLFAHRHNILYWWTGLHIEHVQWIIQECVMVLVFLQWKSVK